MTGGEKIAALDIGLKRIGVALCLDGKTVMPQDAIMRKNRNQAARDAAEFLKSWDVNILVIGLPKGEESEEEMGRRIRHFVGLLKMDKDVEIYYQNEAGSSMEAKEQMQGHIRQKRDGRIDSIAAKIILERWLSDR